MTARNEGTTANTAANRATPEQLRAALKLVLATHAPAYRELAKR